MQNVAGIANSSLSDNGNDSHGLIVANLASLIQRIQQTNALIEAAIIRAAAVFRRWRSPPSWCTGRRHAGLREGASGIERLRSGS